MTRRLLAGVAAVVLALLTVISTGNALVRDQASAAVAVLQVTSPAFRTQQAIPEVHSAYADDISPMLEWSAPPSGTQSVVVVMDDPDAKEPKPFTHWLLYNLPPATRGLPEAVPSIPRLPQYGGALQGQNSRGSVGYYGPKPPAGDPPHRYHFRVFALDRMLPLDPGADRERVMAALKGHILAQGELVGTFERDGNSNRAIF